MPRHERPDEVEKGHQGWRNYETWAVALYLDNDQGTQEYWDEAAQDAYNEAEAERSFTKRERAILDLSARLKQEIDDDAEGLPENGLYADLLNAALQEVYWYEIAEHLIDGLDLNDEGV